MSLTGRNQMFIALEPHGIFYQIIAYLYILTFLDTGMQNDDQALLNINLAGHGYLV